jgi:hypothetical protein
LHNKLYNMVSGLFNGIWCKSNNHTRVKKRMSCSVNCVHITVLIRRIQNKALINVLLRVGVQSFCSVPLSYIVGLVAGMTSSKQQGILSM